MKTLFITVGKAIIAVFMIWALLTVVNIRGRINEKEAERELLAKELHSQQLLNAVLQEDIDSEGQEEYSARMERMARERLGLVSPGEILIVNKTS
ncbi:MAG: septum formation initiator family protein [Oscillospiraceae bacterium]|nr:septum formation initiator family protein [Oscillospiraceae bacterium]